MRKGVVLLLVLFVSAIMVPVSAEEPQVWSTGVDLRGSVTAPLLIGHFGMTEAVVIGSSVAVSMVDVDTGEELWTVQTTAPVSDLELIPDTNSDSMDEILVTTLDAENPSIFALSGADGSLVWAVEYTTEVFLEGRGYMDRYTRSFAAVHHNDRTYASSWNRILHLDSQTGDLLNEIMLEGDVISLSPYMGTDIVATTSDGYAVRLDQEGNTVWSRHVTQSSTYMSGPINTVVNRPLFQAIPMDDLDMDGDVELLVNGDDGYVRMMSGADGHDLYSLKYYTNSQQQTSSILDQRSWRSYQVASVGDVDGDDRSDFAVVGSYNNKVFFADIMSSREGLSESDREIVDFTARISNAWISYDDVEASSKGFPILTQEGLISVRGDNESQPFASIPADPSLVLGKYGQRFQVRQHSSGDMIISVSSSAVFRMDPETGETRWSFSRLSDFQSAIIEHADGTSDILLMDATELRDQQVQGTTVSRIFALDGVTGAVDWVLDMNVSNAITDTLWDLRAVGDLDGDGTSDLVGTRFPELHPWMEWTTFGEPDDRPGSIMAISGEDGAILWTHSFVDSLAWDRTREPGTDEGQLLFRDNIRDTRISSWAVLDDSDGDTHPDILVAGASDQGMALLSGDTGRPIWRARGIDKGDWRATWLMSSIQGDGDFTVRWLDTDGTVLGNETNVSAALSFEEHTLTVELLQGDTVVSSDTIHILPVPEDHPTFDIAVRNGGEEITDTTFTDTQSIELTINSRHFDPSRSNITWRRDDGSILGTDTRLSTFLLQGTHTITATITDEGGRTWYDDIGITVVRGSTIEDLRAWVDGLDLRWNPYIAPGEEWNFRFNHHYWQYCTDIVWDFGDGTTRDMIREETGVMHSYPSAGPRDVSVSFHLVTGEVRVYDFTLHVVEETGPRVRYQHTTHMDPVSRIRAGDWFSLDADVQNADSVRWFLPEGIVEGTGYSVQINTTGNHTVIIEATNSTDGRTARFELELEVMPPAPFWIGFNLEQDRLFPGQNAVVNLDGYGPDINLTIDWGDGTRDGFPWTGSPTPSAIHAYDSPGEYTITTLLRNGEGNVTFHRRLMTIEDTGTAWAEIMELDYYWGQSYDRIYRVGTEVYIGTDEDPNNMDLSVKRVFHGGEVTVDWGDGSPVEVLSGSRNGHAYDKVGVYTIIARVDHFNGTFATAKRTIQVLGVDDPVISIMMNREFREGARVRSLNGSSMLPSGDAAIHGPIDLGDGPVVLMTGNFGDGAIARLYAIDGNGPPQTVLTEFTNDFEMDTWWLYNEMSITVQGDSDGDGLNEIVLYGNGRDLVTFDTSEPRYSGDISVHRIPTEWWDERALPREGQLVDLDGDGSLDYLKYRDYTPMWLEAISGTTGEQLWEVEVGYEEWSEPEMMPFVIFGDSSLDDDSLPDIAVAMTQTVNSQAEGGDKGAVLLIFSGMTGERLAKYSYEEQTLFDDSRRPVMPRAVDIVPDATGDGIPEILITRIIKEGRIRSDLVDPETGGLLRTFSGEARLIPAPDLDGDGLDDLVAWTEGSIVRMDSRFSLSISSTGGSISSDSFTLTWNVDDPTAVLLNNNLVDTVVDGAYTFILAPGRHVLSVELDDGIGTITDSIVVEVEESGIPPGVVFLLVLVITFVVMKFVPKVFALKPPKDMVSDMRTGGDSSENAGGDAQ